ncbi:MAG: transporter [Kiritimatiellae bacterium]|nr:transporter [Kiritimatiellia bacterium]
MPVIAQDAEPENLAAIPGAGVVMADAKTQEGEIDSAAELAKKLANPVASLISVPLQYNYDENYGPHDDGSKSVLNIQPVMPFSLGKEWNLIIRTIIPLVDQEDIPYKGASESGLGDILQSFFFSPKEPVSGWVLAAGPVGLYPTASDETLGGEKWGMGPTALALRQRGPWTYGILANHIWSVAGEDNRKDLSLSFLQPFLAYITKTKTTLTLNSESTYNWEASEWSAPVNAIVSQLLKIGPQIVQISLGARYWAESPDNGAEGWGARAQLTFLFPK